MSVTTRKAGRPPRMEKGAIPVAYMIKPIYDIETEEYKTPSGNTGIDRKSVARTRSHTFRLKKPQWDAHRQVFRDVDVAVTVALPCRTDKCEAMRKGFTNKDMMTAVDELVKSGSQLIAFTDDRSGRQPLAMKAVKLYEVDINAIDANATVESARAARDRSDEVERQQNEVLDSTPSTEFFAELKGVEAVAA